MRSLTIFVNQTLFVIVLSVFAVQVTLGAGKREFSKRNKGFAHRDGGGGGGGGGYTYGNSGFSGSGYGGGGGGGYGGGGGHGGGGGYGGGGGSPDKFKDKLSLLPLLALAPLALLALPLLFPTTTMVIPPVIPMMMGKRKKRAIGSEEEQILRSFLYGALKEENTHFKSNSSTSRSLSPSAILSKYMSCDSQHILERCFERLVCEYKSPTTQMEELEQQVTEITLRILMSKSHLDESLMDRLNRASTYGIKNVNSCQKRYPCDVDVSSMTRVRKTKNSTQFA
ncbi:uncharacterized protein [Lepeophtheirus salmonis]|uniref:uncharacterized protein n=1 Tax=Lepeophtheirus salmonis TaxID=72036 RepID=UPI003AF365E7